MSVIESPSQHATEAEVDPTFASLRASLRPIDYKRDDLLGGHFRVPLSTGLVTGAAAAAALLSMRWAKSDRVFVLLRVLARAVVTTPSYPSPVEFSVDLVKVKNFTAADTGGTTIALGDENRAHGAMANSQVTDLRVATTGALGAGTGSAEALAKAVAIFKMANQLGEVGDVVLFDAIAGAEHPEVFLDGQGFRIRLKEAQGTSGVTRFNFTLVWAELPKGF